MSDNVVATGPLLRRTAAVVSGERGTFLLLFLINAAASVAFVVAPGVHWLATTVPVLVDIYLALVATTCVLERLDLAPSPSSPLPSLGRFAAATLLFVMVVPSIVVGLLFLIVPGVLLAAMWSLAVPILVAERRPVLTAMGRSWRLVEPHLGVFVELVVLTLLPLLLAGLLNWAALTPLLGERLGDVIEAVVNAAVTILIAAVWAVVYAACRAREEAAPDLTPPIAPLHPRTYV